MTQRLVSPFVDGSRLLQPNVPELSYGCLMADIDDDGLPEILVATVNGGNRLYRWKGDRLVDCAPPEVRDPEGNGIGVACGDFSGQGRLDLYILNTTAFLGPFSDPDRLLINSGGLQFTDLFAGDPDRNEAAGRSVCFLDVDGRGDYGVFVANYAAPCRLYVRGAGGMAEDIAPSLGLDIITGGRAVVAGDFLGTGRMDLFTGNENDVNRYFRNEGNRIFREVAAKLGLQDMDEHMRGLTIGDFNRDGRMDFVWGNWQGPHRLMLQASDGSFANYADVALANPSSVRTVIAFDYDNDGWEDLFFNNIGEPNRLFHNNGDGTFSEVSLGNLALAGGLGTGATVGDLNGDGFLDLFISHGEQHPQPNVLMLNRPNGNHWLRIHAKTPNGAPAIGARVTVFAEGDDRPMTRIIDGGSGYLCQMEPVAHFGLGAARRASKVHIRFPNGREATLENIEADHNVIVRPRADADDMLVQSISADE